MHTTPDPESRPSGASLAHFIVVPHRLEIDIMLGNWASARLKDMGEVRHICRPGKRTDFP
eukprot:scaffold5009_cov103-Isochrysis_galbana.AAC.6